MSTAVLTKREREVAILFARGLTYRDIATEAKISPSGVRYYSTVLRAKLGVKTSREVAKALVDHGLATAEEVL